MTPRRKVKCTMFLQPRLGQWMKRQIQKDHKTNRNDLFDEAIDLYRRVLEGKARIVT